MSSETGRLKLFLSYDGTYYSGWQRQKNTPNTVQEILENKLSVLANSKVSLMASGRTDAGVHARIQVAHVDMPRALLDRLDNDRIRLSLNSLLPPDIRLAHIERVADSFHALKDVQKKTYLYFIDPTPIQWPELRNHAWHLRLPLDWNAMEEAAAHFVGEHDFKAFCAADTTANSTVRKLFEVKWGVTRWSGISGSCQLRVLRVTGTGFLKSMVRSIAGTLVHVGSGKAKPAQVLEGLKTRNRKLAGPTAPARGLWLWDILYT